MFVYISFNNLLLLLSLVSLILQSTDVTLEVFMRAVILKIEKPQI